MPVSPQTLAPEFDRTFLMILRKSATHKIIEFLSDPGMAEVRLRLRRGLHGPDSRTACRHAVLEQLGTLGEPGPRLGLLVYSLETLLSVVNWDQVATALVLLELRERRSVS